MDDRRIRPGVWLSMAGLAAVLAIVVITLEMRRPAPTSDEATPPARDESATAPPPVASQPGSRERDARPAARPTPSAVDPVPYIEGLVYGEIDLREARELMPDNHYWKFGSPTKDPEILAARDEEKKRRNEEYGRVLAGDASEEEVRAYYDYRKRLSSDYLEFSEFMQRRFREKGSDQFIGMLELAMKLHASRLAQLPAELDDALGRSREHEKARADWKRQREEFGDAPDQEAQ